MTLQTQWLTMALMLGSGLMLGVILDTYRVLKGRFRLRGWVVSLIDLLYWTVSAGLVFSLLMWSNWGELRFYIFIAVCAGLLLYYNWFSRQTIRVIRLLVQAIERILHWMVVTIHALIWVPLVQLWVLLHKLFQLLFKLLLSLGKAGLKLFVPIEWLTRPLRKRLQVWLMPYVEKGRHKFEIIKMWWSKIRKKG